MSHGQKRYACRGTPREPPLQFYILMLTWRCNAACPHCCWASHPRREGLMAVDDALEYLEQAHELPFSPGTVNFSGGEVGLYFDHLVSILEAAATRNLCGPYRVETNGFYCTSADVARRKFSLLKKLNVRGVDLTQDPYHLPFLNFESMSVALAAAREVFGSKEVNHYGRFGELEAYYAEHGTLDGCPAADVRQHAAARGALYVGRAATCIAPLRAETPVDDLPFACLNSERGWTVNPRLTNQISILPEGSVTPGACVGVGIGDAKREPVAQILTRPPDEQPPLIQTLIEQGPRGLVSEFVGKGGQLRECYASVCHLCWEVRSLLRDVYPAALIPAHLYEDDPRWVRRGRELVGMGGGTR